MRTRIATALAAVCLLACAVVSQTSVPAVVSPDTGAPGVQVETTRNRVPDTFTFQTNTAPTIEFQTTEGNGLMLDSVTLEGDWAIRIVFPDAGKETTYRIRNPRLIPIR